MLITHANLVLWGPSPRILADHALHISGDRIDKIGSSSSLEQAYPKSKRLDAAGQLVMPGNICAHTHFYGAFARGLGIPGRVHSPTFTLVNVYRGGRLTLFHLDLYRLPPGAGRAQILAAGLEDYLSPTGVTVIEWAEKWFGEIPDATRQPSRIPELYRRVSIETVDETGRRIVYEDFGA